MSQNCGKNKIYQHRKCFENYNVLFKYKVLLLTVVYADINENQV